MGEFAGIVVVIGDLGPAGVVVVMMEAVCHGEGGC